MSAMMASSTLEQVGAIGASVIAVLTGIGAFLTSRRVRRAEAENKQRDAEQAEIKQAAEVNRASIEGWERLIETLGEQYKTASEEATALRKRLTAGNRRFDRMERNLQRARTHIGRQDIRIALLSNEVERLGGHIPPLPDLVELDDVDEDEGDEDEPEEK